MHRFSLSCLAVVFAMYTGAANAAETIISNPNNAKWTPYGKVKPNYVETNSVPGGVALRLAIRAKGNNPWDIGVNAQMLGGIAKGDAVTAGFFSRLARPPKNRQVAMIVARMQQNVSAYESAMEASVDVNDAWTFYCVEGIATRDISKGTLELSLQLASDKQTLDIGPYLVVKHEPGEKPALPCQKLIKAGG
jgi:hypothetical protein